MLRIIRILSCFAAVLKSTIDQTMVAGLGYTCNKQNVHGIFSAPWLLVQELVNHHNERWPRSSHTNLPLWMHELPDPVEQHLDSVPFSAGGLDMR